MQISELFLYPVKSLSGVSVEKLNIASPCTKCAMLAVNPETAEKEMEVIEALNQHRRFGTETRFGQNMVYEKEGEIIIGDTIEVVS